VFTETLSRNGPGISAHLGAVAKQRLYTLQYFPGVSLEEVLKITKTSVRIDSIPA
jgi:hypothetical protein